MQGHDPAIFSWIRILNNVQNVPVGTRLMLLPLQQQTDIVLMRVGVLQLRVVMLRLLVVVVRGRMLLFLMVDSGLPLVDLLELSLVVLLVLC
jgi:hypothetical protein